MSGPVRLSHNGQGSADLDLTTPGPFEELLARFRQRSTDQNLALLAHVAAAALDFRKDDPVHHPLLAPAVAALCDALPGLDDCLRRKFDAKAYFESAPRAVALRAIVEVLGEQKCHALRLSTKGKSELAKFALANVAPAGWLPPQLRTPTYRLMSSLEGDTPEAKDDAAKPSAKKRSRK
jgi:ParB family chromosome partitioning protein